LEEKGVEYFVKSVIPKTGILVVLVCYLITGCSYLKSRGRDFTDIVTLSGEGYCANVSCQIAFLPFGAGWAEGKGFGSRIGHLGSYEYKEINVLTYTERTFGPDNLPRGKAYKMKGFWFVIPLYYINFIPSFIKHKGSLASQCQIEVAAGLGAGLRAGVNPGEALDFLLGFFTVDIFKDDFPGEKGKKSPQDSDNKSLPKSK
jgi:hypothetical protein